MNIHLKSALSSIRRSPFQAFAAVFVLTLTFFFATLVTVLTYASGNILHFFATKPQIIAFLKSDATPAQISDFQGKLMTNNMIKNVHYVSKEEALKIYKEATSDNPLLSELVSPAVFPASLEFSVSDIAYVQEVISEVKKEGIVDSVGFTAAIGGEKTLGDVVDRLKKVTSYVRVGGAAFVAVLGAASFLVLLVIVGMRMSARKSEIEILDLIGATGSFIKSPIVLEAGLYSLSGVFLGWLAAFVIALYATPSLISYFGEIPVLPKEMSAFFLFFAAILGLEIVAGLILALAGSLLAVSRVKRSQ